VGGGVFALGARRRSDCLISTSGEEEGIRPMSSIWTLAGPCFWMADFV
jgi:hypothetical protein